MADDNFAEVALAEKPDTRPVCSAATPAPNGRVTAHGMMRKADAKEAEARRLRAAI